MSNSNFLIKEDNLQILKKTACQNVVAMVTSYLMNKTKLFSNKFQEKSQSFFGFSLRIKRLPKK